MKKKELRAFALRDPKGFRRYIRGARERDLAARYFLLHPDQVSSASPADLEALQEYIHDRGWRSLYGHDRRMYRLLKAGAAQLKLEGMKRHRLDLLHRLAALIDVNKLNVKPGETVADALACLVRHKSIKQLDQMIYELESGEPG